MAEAILRPKHCQAARAQACLLVRTFPSFIVQKHINQAGSKEERAPQQAIPAPARTAFPEETAARQMRAVRCARLLWTPNILLQACSPLLSLTLWTFAGEASGLPDTADDRSAISPVPFEATSSRN